MTDETKAPSSRPSRGKRERRAPWMEAMLADWRQRWPAVFTQPVPLASGTGVRVKEALRAAGITFSARAVGAALHSWTLQSAYLHAITRGEPRRNLDGSEAGVPDAEMREKAKQMLIERAARRAEKKRRRTQAEPTETSGTP